MEATIQTNNQTINIGINVSVNIDAMKASIQHLWFMVKGSWLRVAGAWSLPRLYRKVLRMMYAAERATERHPVIADSILWLIGIGLVAEIFLFC